MLELKVVFNVIAGKFMKVVFEGNSKGGLIRVKFIIRQAVPDCWEGKVGNKQEQSIDRQQ